MKRGLPELASDQAAADFVAAADLTEFDLSGLKSTRFELAAKEAPHQFALPGELLAAVKGHVAPRQNDSEN